MTKQTIPRLELLGALSLAQLVVKFKSSIAEVHKTVYWTDSMTTLCWSKNQRIWKQYVQHQVDEIHSLTPKEAWRHCPSHLNPADLPLRGLNAVEGPAIPVPSRNRMARESNNSVQR